MVFCCPICLNIWQLTAKYFAHYKPQPTIFHGGPDFSILELRVQKNSPVDVSQDLWENLEYDAAWCDFVHAYGFQQQDELDGRPAEAEHDYNHKDKAGDTFFVPEWLLSHPTSIWRMAAEKGAEVYW